MEKEILFDSEDKEYPDYRLKVVRETERSANLTVTYKDNPIYQETVGLSYGAVFGVDVMDMDYWGNTAVRVVDEHRAKNA